MANKMFRYLERNYMGKYRVLAYYDLATEDFPREDDGSIPEDYDEQYIKCQKGEIRASYRQDKDKDVLYWFTESNEQGKNILKLFQAIKPKIWLEADESFIGGKGNGDFIIYFDAKDIDKIAKIVKPNTSGSKIKPYSNKNLPKPPYEIPKSDAKMLEAINKALDSKMSVQDRALFMAHACKSFDKVIQEKKGAKYDINKVRKTSKLTGKQFIHSIGMWKEYIKFLEEEIKNIKG